jgi:hypothetical protein
MTQARKPRPPKKPLPLLPDRELNNKVMAIRIMAHQSAKTGQVLAEQMREGLETFSEEVD